MKKLWKQVRGQKFGNESENGNRLNIELNVYYIEQNSTAFAIPILTAI